MVVIRFVTVCLLFLSVTEANPQRLRRIQNKADKRFLKSADANGNKSCGERDPEAVCAAVIAPVQCGGGCKFSNICEAQASGWNANACKDDPSSTPLPP